MNIKKTISALLSSRAIQAPMAIATIFCLSAHLIYIKIAPVPAPHLLRELHIQNTVWKQVITNLRNVSLENADSDPDVVRREFNRRIQIVVHELVRWFSELDVAVVNNISIDEPISLNSESDEHSDSAVAISITRVIVTMQLSRTNSIAKLLRLFQSGMQPWPSEVRSCSQQTHVVVGDTEPNNLLQECVIDIYHTAVPIVRSTKNAESIEPAIDELEYPGSRPTEITSTISTLNSKHTKIKNVVGFKTTTAANSKRYKISGIIQGADTHIFINNLPAMANANLKSVEWLELKIQCVSL